MDPLGKKKTPSFRRSFFWSVAIDLKPQETSGHDELKVEDKEDDTNDVIGVL